MHENMEQRWQGGVITYVDADDLPGERLMERLVSKMNAEEIDLVTSGHVTQTPDGSEHQIFDGSPVGIYATEEEKQVIYRQIVESNKSRSAITVFMWGKLFRTKLALKVFDEVDERIRQGEDREFTCRYILKSRTICISDICEYYKCYEPSSISHRNWGKYLMYTEMAYMSLKEVFGSHPYSCVLMTSLDRWMYDRVHNVMYEYEIITEFTRRKYLPQLLIQILSEKKVALYGAGYVGQIYYHGLKEMDVHPVVWVDRQFAKYQDLECEIKAPEELFTLEIDYVMIAIEDADIAHEVKQYLVQNGIDKNTILWSEGTYF